MLTPSSPLTCLGWGCGEAVVSEASPEGEAPLGSQPSGCAPAVREALSHTWSVCGESPAISPAEGQLTPACPSGCGTKLRSSTRGHWLGVLWSRWTPTRQLPHTCAGLIRPRKVAWPQAVVSREVWAWAGLGEDSP